VTLIGPSDSRAPIRPRARRGWVVLDLGLVMTLPGHPDEVSDPPATASACLASLAPRYAVGSFRVYGPA
jgi:hypothetical protein